MSGRKADQAPISCTECRAQLQEYLDGTMVKTESLRIFLHLRECTDCAAEHAQWQTTYQMLDSLPSQALPEDFDSRILKSVPYESYRAMANLRRARVPVFLETEALPAVVRSLRTRLTGLSIALVSAVAIARFDAPQTLGWIALAGLLPEATVRLQGLGRVTLLALRRSEG